MITVLFLIAVISMASCSGPGNQEIIVKNGPRLGLVTATEAVINWDTFPEYRGAVSYRVAGEAEFKGKALSGEVTNRQSVTINNLKPKTKYEYLIEGDQTVWSFTTATTDTASFVFVTMADNRGQSDTEDLIGLPVAFINIINDAVKRDSVFAVNAGDLFYGKNPNIDTFRKLYHSFKTAIHPLASKIPYYISPGNHEMSPFTSSSHTPGFDPVQLFNTEIHQPAQLEGYEGTVFSWNYGKVHFVSIATNQFNPLVLTPLHAMYYVSDAQISWLDKDLKKAKIDGAEFIFVFGHANAFRDPAWPDAGDLGDLEYTDIAQRDKFWNVLVANQVNAYICGHRHFFDVSTHGGVVQWMNGNSGSVVGGPNQYTVWTVNGTLKTVTAELVDDTGTKDPTKTRTFTK